MNDVELKINDNGQGAFQIHKDSEQLAEMRIGISGSNLIVYHTEVSEKLKGQGIGPRLLEAMTTYARENQLKIVPLCPFVNSQFRRHPERYEDIWNKNWR